MFKIFGLFGHFYNSKFAVKRNFLFSFFAGARWAGVSPRGRHHGDGQSRPALVDGRAGQSSRPLSSHLRHAIQNLKHHSHEQNNETKWKTDFILKAYFVIEIKVLPTTVLIEHFLIYVLKCFFNIQLIEIFMSNWLKKIFVIKQIHILMSQMGERMS